MLSAKITKRGFEYDRHWLVIEEKTNKMITQRVCPRMALISTFIDVINGYLVIRADGMSELKVPLHPSHSNDIITVTVWGEPCGAIDTGNEAALWFSEFLGKSGLRLVRFCDSFIRPSDPKYAPKGQTAFSDGFAFLLTSIESLQSLNLLLHQPVTMERFRPNIVVSGSQPFEEDHWDTVSIGKSKFSVVKPCARCKIPTIDSNTGNKYI